MSKGIIDGDCVVYKNEKYYWKSGHWIKAQSNLQVSLDVSRELEILFSPVKICPEKNHPKNAAQSRKEFLYCQGGSPSLGKRHR